MGSEMCIRDSALADENARHRKAGARLVNQLDQCKKKVRQLEKQVREINDRGSDVKDIARNSVKRDIKRGRFIIQDADDSFNGGGRYGIL